MTGGGGGDGGGDISIVPEAGDEIGPAGLHGFLYRHCLSGPEYDALIISQLFPVRL